MTVNTSNKKRSFIAHRIAQKALIAIPGAIGLMGSASAEVLNVTEITGIFSDLTAIFPAIGNFVVSVLPTLMMLAVVGFVLGFFDKILSVFDRVL